MSKKEWEDWKKRMETKNRDAGGAGGNGQEAPERSVGKPTEKAGATIRNRTYEVSRFYYLPHRYDKNLWERIDKDAESIKALTAGLGKVLAPILAQDFIFMANQKFWLDSKLLALYPTPDACDRKKIFGNSEDDVRRYKKTIDGFVFHAPTFEELDMTFSPERKNPYQAGDERLTFFHDGHNKGSYYRDNDERVYPDFLPTCTVASDCIAVNDNHLLCYFPGNKLSTIYGEFGGSNCMFLLPICRLGGGEPGHADARDVLACLLDNKLIPAELGEQRENYETLLRVWKAIKRYVSVKASSLVFDAEAYRKENFAARRDICRTKGLQSDRLQAYGADDLCRCDYVRANKECYEERRLQDLNLGHWELCETPMAGQEEAKLPEGVKWVARPPQLDVKEGGICAIDFGTKSTVVVCWNRDDKQDARLLRIGKEDLTAAPEETDYENPTAVELRGFSDFMEAYRSREGRPFTCWEDMTVSHQAVQAMFSGFGNYCVFNELKQWANDSERRVNLSDQKGKTLILPPYAELAEGDFDPIEIYAYYLGLYINNMVHGIYLDYIMSFPVNYGLDVRERIRTSFERGLRKSLPPFLLRDADMMKRFRVQKGCSEPAAYAITALHEFGLEPTTDEEKVAYGVYDFGGGTTDFDFGIESTDPKGRYHYCLEQFGAGGDEYLGGEHILALMAYEVFKSNVDTMREKGVHIVFPVGAERFPGSEVLVEERNSASQAAVLNMRILTKFLRPIWERQPGFEKLFSDEKSPEDDLYTASGNRVAVTLRLHREVLDRLVKDRIAKGVDSFFSKLKESFHRKEYGTKIHIFLAGNAGKAQVVRELFDERIRAEEEAAEKNVGASGLYCLHMPLSVSEEGAKEEKAPAAKGSSPAPEYDRRRTGKTGVAFGLLRCRKGARDVLVINQNDDADAKEVKFPFYIGVITREGKFKVTVGPDVPYGSWVEYFDASESEIELRYTKEARAQEGVLTEREVSVVRLYLDESEVSEDEDVGVFLRKKSPDTLEYVVGRKKQGAPSADAFEILGGVHEVKLS